MTLASLGWGCWWAALFLAKFTETTPDLRFVEWAAALFGVPGLLIAIFTLRAQKAWLYIAAIPLFANLGLLLLPWVIPSGLFAAGG